MKKFRRKMKISFINWKFLELSKSKKLQQVNLVVFLFPSDLTFLFYTVIWIVESTYPKIEKSFVSTKKMKDELVNRFNGKTFRLKKKEDITANSGILKTRIHLPKRYYIWIIRSFALFQCWFDWCLLGSHLFFQVFFTFFLLRFFFLFFLYTVSSTLLENRLFKKIYHVFIKSCNKYSSFWRIVTTSFNFSFKKETIRKCVDKASSIINLN